MEKMPFFSVVIPTHNRDHSLPKAAQSVLHQKFTNWEMIVVDDGSTDNTREVVQCITDVRVKYVYQNNRERSAARNKGISYAKGKYICFLDSDDYMLEDHLSSFYKIIEQKNFPVAMFYCNTIEDRNGELIKVAPPSIPAENNIEFVLLNTIGVPRTCIHRDILVEHKFNEKIRIGEDVELWVRILRKYPLIYNPEYTTVFTTHGGRSVSHDNIQSRIENLRVRQHIIDSDKVGNISSDIRKKVISDCWLRLAICYRVNNMSFKFFTAIIRSIFIHPFYRIKEKTYMISEVLHLTSK